MNILITGSSGFLGRNLFKELSKNKKINLTLLNSKNCNLLEEKNLNKYNNIKFKFIFHLAAWVQGGSFVQENSAEVWINNQKINSNLLSWISKHQKRAKIICIGTSGSYDPKHKLVESNYLKGNPHESLYSYGMTKRMLLVGLKTLNEQYKIKYLNIVPSTIYGPNYHINKRKNQFIYDLINKILDGKFKKKKVVLWGNGLQKRELIYVRDLVQIIINLYDKIDNQTINVSSNNNKNIKDYANIICKLLNYNFKKIHFDETKFVGVKNRSINNKFVLKILKDFKFTNINDGIEKTIDWYVKNVYFKNK